MCLAFLAVWPSSPGGICDAQTETTDAESKKQFERDREVPREKVEAAKHEAQKIMDGITAAMKERKPQYVLVNANSRKYDVPGKRGTTDDEITWRFANTQIWLAMHLGLTTDKALIDFREGLETIEMGDFFDIPRLGDKSVLVKYVTQNTKNTTVNLYFVKGRAEIKLNVTSPRNKTSENEKLLMEAARLIEPLINARPNFDD
jgi:hypothetical protein